MQKRDASTSEGQSSAMPLSDGLAPLVAKVRDIDQSLDELRALVNLRRIDVERVIASISLLRRKQAAELLSISTSQLDREVRKGALTPVFIDRSPRFSVERLQAYLSSREASKSPSRRSVGWTKPECLPQTRRPWRSSPEQPDLSPP